MSETTPQQEILAELRARREQLELQRAALEALPPDDEIAREQRAVDDAEALNKALQEHGRLDEAIVEIKSTLGSVILKRASAMRYKKFQDVGDFSVQACEQLIRPNVIYPSMPVLNEMLEKQPMIAMRAANALGYLAVILPKDVEKK